jgi:UDP-N-acetylglucosamine 3-dehydrogenase
VTPVRIGILGAGAMGAAHAAAYADIADATVVGVFSRDPARARSVAATCKAEPFGDAADLIGNAGVDAIDVCLPSAVHHAFVIPALAAGKHVFCETPLALRLDDARQMLDAARRAGRLLQVGLLMRSLGAYGHIKAVTASGEHGRLLSVATWRLGSYLHPDAPDHKAHYSDPSTELMTFDFDFIQWLMGPPGRLSASAARTQAGAPGEISALLSYQDGRHATVVASGLMPPGFPFSAGFRALFEGAAFEHRSVFENGPPKSTFTIVAGKAPAQPVPTPARNPYQVELQRFVDCINGRADPELLDAERAIEALMLSEATQRALAG